jgi:hypothetical protein
MIDNFAVADLDVERLLSEWRWLCPNQMKLVARNVYGDLFLCDSSGCIFWLDVGSAWFKKVADCECDFRELAQTVAKKEEWFAESEVSAAAARGLKPSTLQCIGFKTPVVFEESASVPDNAYVADLYECVSFLGDLSHQLADVPDGSRVKLIVGPKPAQSG